MHRLWPGLVLLLCLCSSLNVAGQTGSEGIAVPNPGSELWREVRQRSQPLPPGGQSEAPGLALLQEIRQRRLSEMPVGRSQLAGSGAGAVFINSLGDTWRRLRMERLVPIGGYLLGGALLLVLLFYLIRGRVPIRAGRSQHKLYRYSPYERLIHWFIAFNFILLALSGLILLFGRSLLLPWMGPQLFSAVASASKEGHNLFGPLFLLALALIFLQFVRRNIYQKGDLTWLLRGGGVIGKKHVPSNFFNMGEKTMFWMLILVGGVTALSGLVLLFPLFGQGRELMALSHLAHAVTAIVMITVIIGHIYIGTIGMEGALEGMRTGYCDLNWAREHHDWWAQKCEERGETVSAEDVARARGEVSPAHIAEERGR
ncbi:MAG: formate dehydrogenase subunit gamma [Gammaproteobacteria bacterium]|nr:formate dehydrogenase subunit gamma [Gammaproteobacteria bacterium]